MGYALFKFMEGWCSEKIYQYDIGTNFVGNYNKYSYTDKWICWKCHIGKHRDTKINQNTNLPETTTVEETKVVDEEVTLELMKEKRVMLMSYGNTTVIGKVVDSNGNGKNNAYVDTCGIAVNPKAFTSVIADTDYSS